MLLGSPPDMVHGVPLRETGSAAICGGAIHSFSILLYGAGIGNKNFLPEKNRLYKGRNYGIIAFAAGAKRIRARSSVGSAKGSVFCHIYNFILLYSSVPLLELLIWAYSSAGRAYGSHP